MKLHSHEVGALWKFQPYFENLEQNSHLTKLCPFKRIKCSYDRYCTINPCNSTNVLQRGVAVVIRARKAISRKMKFFSNDLTWFRRWSQNQYSSQCQLNVVDESIEKPRPKFCSVCDSNENARTCGGSRYQYETKMGSPTTICIVIVPQYCFVLPIFENYISAVKYLLYNFIHVKSP